MSKTQRSAPIYTANIAAADKLASTLPNEAAGTGGAAGLSLQNTKTRSLDLEPIAMTLAL